MSKFNELYEQVNDKFLEASIFDPIKPKDIARSKTGKDRIISFKTPMGNKVSVVFREYPNKEAELSFKVNDDTNADPDRKYDKDIARMILWVVQDELKGNPYDEIGILPEYDTIDRTGLQRKRTFIKMIKKFLPNYKVLDFDEEESDFTIVPKDKAMVEAKLGKCLRKSLELIDNDPSLKLMMGPSGRPEDTSHFWVVTPDGKVIDKASDRVSKDYEYNGREVDPKEVRKELNESNDPRVPDDVREINIGRNIRLARENGIKTDGEFMLLYHGTSNANIKKINKSGRFNKWSWFGETEDISKLFAKRNHGDRSSVMTVLLYAGSLIPHGNGYWDSQEALYYKEGKYMPKDML